MGSDGQLGTGNDEDALTPVEVKGKQLEDKKAMRVSSGGQHALLLAIKRR